ncbi:MAG: hypothetical protein ABFD97_01405 [Syntrophobacter sp.]
MARELTVVSGSKLDEEETVVSPEEKYRLRQNVMGVVLKDAQHTWAEMWRDLQGEVTDGVVILPEAEKGCKPKCGWSEFLEKMWLLKHYIDYAQRFSEGKM